MIKRIWYRLFPKYEVIKVIHAEWLSINSETYSHIVYEILYSKRLNHYKLMATGLRYKQHPIYKNVIEELYRLNHGESNSI